MPKNKSVSGALNKIKPYFIGVVKGFGLFSVLYIGLAFFMYKTNSNSAILYYLIFLFIILGGFVCGVHVYKKVRGRGFLTGLISTVPYSIFVFLLFCFMNGFKLSGDIFLVFLLSFSGGFLGGITAANTKI